MLNENPLSDYAYQGEPKYLTVLKNHVKQSKALITTLKVINSMYNVQFIAHLNGHKILDMTMPRIDEPSYFIDVDD